MKRCFVFYTQFNHEKKVHEELIRRGFDSIYPCIKNIKQWSDRKKMIESPMFPCYNFVYCELIDLYTILETKGIVNVVKFSGEMAYLSERDLDLMRKLELHQHGVIVTNQKFNGEEKIIIESGCFQGVTGTIVEENENEKLVLLLDLLGHSVVTTFVAYKE